MKSYKKFKRCKLCGKRWCGLRPGFWPGAFCYGTQECRDQRGPRDRKRALRKKYR